MKSVIVILGTLCVYGGSNATIYDEELYRSALDPVLCDSQLEVMDKNQFYAASFRVPQGVSGHFEDYGNFYQCLGINQRHPGMAVQGKYCVIRAQVFPTFRMSQEPSNVTRAELKPNKTESKAGTRPQRAASSLRLGVCVPRVCAAHALLPAHFNYSLEFCRLPNDKPYTTIDYVALFILSLLGLLTVVSTTYEMHHIYILKKEPEQRDEWLCTFSLHRNTRLLMAAVPGGLPCLHAVRALSVLWIILLHSSIGLRQHSVNEEEISESVSSGQRYFLVSAGHLAVDSFFVLSGLLLVYTSAGKTESLSLRNLPRFYLNRYVRLFPLLAAAVLLRAVEPRITEGPTAVDRAAGPVRCRKYWWSALLHVQNIVNPREMCLGHSWYLSVDMQLHMLSALLLCGAGAARADPRLGRRLWPALAAATLAALAAALAFCFYYNFTDVTRDSPRNWASSAASYWTWYYYNPIVRSPPFFIGMLFGYGLYVLKNEKLHLPKWSIWLCHIWAVALCSLVMLAEHPGARAVFDHQSALGLKLALYRSCWALALGWLILACTQGYAGPVNWFLSLRLWRFVARISYAMYLFSNIIQEEPDATGSVNYFDMRTLLWTFSGDAAAAVALSVALIVLVETPLHTLLAPLLKRTTHKS